MSEEMAPATRFEAKQRAKALRAERAANGETISHAEALERIAKSLGFRDWNTASARLTNAPDAPVQVGDRVSGRYLKQPFTGRVLAVRSRADGGAFDVTVDFDKAVDVVAWDSFSSFRKRVNVQVSLDGRSWSKTSDGEPHMVLERVSDMLF